MVQRLTRGVVNLQAQGRRCLGWVGAAWCGLEELLHGEDVDRVRICGLAQGLLIAAVRRLGFVDLSGLSTASSSFSSSLSDLYSVARRISFELQEGLIRLERLEGKGHGGNATLQEAREQRNKLQEMTRISQQMESQFRVLIVKENPSKRDTWKRKVSQISEECDQFRVALDRFGSRESRRMQEEQEREELMRRISGGGNMNNGGGDVTLNMGSSYDAEASAGMSMRRSGQMVDDLLDSGANILGSLHEQKDRLKSARRKVLSVLDTLGVSQSVLKVIDRRQRMDAIIVYGGMFFITFFIFVFWWFTRR